MADVDLTGFDEERTELSKLWTDHMYNAECAVCHHKKHPDDDELCQYANKLGFQWWNRFWHRRVEGN